MEYTYKDALRDAKDILVRGVGKFVILFITCLFAGAGWYYVSLTPVNYTAKSVFYPDRDATMSGSPLELLAAGPSAVTNKAGALGILSKVFDSRSMTKLVVSHKLEKGAGAEILADLIIEDNNKTFKPWQQKDNVAEMSKQSRIERAASLIRGGSFAIVDESGFMSLTTKANNKDLALLINKIMIQELIKFNFDKKTAKAAADMHFINARLDSVASVYESLKYRSANYADANKYMIKQTVKIPMDDLEEQKKILATRYLKLIDLQEQAFIRLQTDKPVVQVLDSPYIDVTKHPSTSGAAVAFGLIGFLLSIGYLLRNVVIKFIRTELAKNKQSEDDSSEEA